MRTLLCLALLILSGQAFASARDDLQLSLNTYERLATDRLRSGLARFVVPLDRELITFHYQRADSTESYRPSSLAEIVRTSDNWGREFFNPDNAGADMMGPGHYVSTDLTGSRSFGGGVDPQLYVTVLKKSARTLDVRNFLGKEDPILTDLQVISKTFNCLHDNRGIGESLQSWFGLFRNSPSLACRKILIQAMAELKIDAILYSYSAANDLANCRHDRSEAVSIIDPRAFDKNQLAYFSNKGSFDPKHIGGFLNRLYDEGLQDFSLRLGLNEQDEAKPSTLSSLVSDPSAYETWKASFVYKCGSLRAQENTQSATSASISDLIRKVQDRDIVLAKFHLFRASRKFMTQGGYIAFERMRGYVDLVAEQAGVSPQTWRKAENAYYHLSSSGAQGLIQVAEILGETCNPEPGSMTSAEDLLSLWKSASTDVNAAFQNLIKKGLSPRLAKLILNVIYSMSQGVPMVVESPPLPAGTNSAAMTAKNKAAYITYLRQCLTQLEQATSWSQFNAGSCGLYD